MIYGFLLAMLMTFACLIAVNILSPQNTIIIAAALIAVVGVIVFDAYKNRKERLAF